MKEVVVLLILMFGWIGKIALLALPFILFLMKEKVMALFFSIVTAFVVVGYSIPESIAEHYRLRPILLLCLMVAQGVYFTFLVGNVAVKHFQKKWRERV